ncbi:MAG: hypothetical protein AB7O56_15675 [Bauldia sp.]
MAKASTRKLKVFQTRIGFHDLLIATGSRAAALRAFGTKQDLFAQGLASQIEDPELVAAASAHPDTVLRRPAGSDIPFGIGSAKPRLDDIDPEGATKEEAATVKPAGGRKASPPPPPPPSRRKLDRAEAALAELEQEQEEADADLQRQIDAIEAEEDRLRARRRALNAERDAKNRMWRTRISDATDEVTRERRAYREAGGKD